MFATVIVLSIITALLVLYMLAVVAHIRAIQKELESISKVEQALSHDIVKMYNSYLQLIAAVNEITTYLNQNSEVKSITPWNGQMGTA